MVVTISGGYKKNNIITLNAQGVDISFVIMENDNPDNIINDLITECIFVKNVSFTKSVIQLLLNKRFIKIE
jgi:hypothetical protein